MLKPKRILMLAGLLALIAAPLPAVVLAQPKSATAPATASPPAVAAKVDVLVAQLSGDDWKARQSAQDALIDLGSEARPRLEEALKTIKDEEARTRIEAALKQIYENRQGGPSIITMDLKGVSAKAAFTELARQSSWDIRTQPGDLLETRDVKIDAVYDHKPYWEVIRDLGEKCGVAFAAPNFQDPELVLVERAGGGRFLMDAPCSTVGPFLVTANNINRNNSVDLTQPKAVRRSATIQFQAYPEPKLRVLQGSSAPRLEEATDDKGNSVLSNQNMYEGVSYRQGAAWPLNCVLQPKDDTGNRIARLKGSAKFLIQTRSETAEIPDVLAAKSVAKTLGGRRMSLKEVRKNGDAYSAMITIYRNGMNPNEMFGGGGNAFHTMFRMLDSDGKALYRQPTAGWNSNNGEQIEITVTFMKKNPNAGAEAASSGEPAKLLWEVPIESKQIVVPFDFKDLPLP